MEKLVLHRIPKMQQNIRPARIEVDAYEKLEELKQQTGLSICKLTSICIDFAYENAVILDSTGDED